METILKQIFKKHKKTLKYLTKKHRKLIICFSGIPCSGKTYIAKIIEERYKAVRISNDDIRKIIRDLGKKHPRLLDESYKEEILDKYRRNLLENYLFRNGLIILDSGIERKYDKITQIAKKHNFKLFIISVKAHLKILKQRVMAKPGWPDKNFINNINRWTKENNLFNIRKLADFIIDNSKNIKPDLSSLFLRLDKIIKQSDITSHYMQEKGFEPL